MPTGVRNMQIYRKKMPNGNLSPTYYVTGDEQRMPVGVRAFVGQFPFFSFTLKSIIKVWPCQGRFPHESAPSDRYPRACARAA